MAYETGVATSAHDLLGKFKVFAENNGWTINLWDNHPSSGKELCIQKGTSFFGFRSIEGDNQQYMNGSKSSTTSYGILIMGADGYTPGVRFDMQPGHAKTMSTGAENTAVAPKFTPMTQTLGPFQAYHFFAPNDDNLYCELEVVAGTFVRFGCGKLDTYGPMHGDGRFFYGTCGAWAANNWDATRYDLSTAYEMVPFTRPRYADGPSYPSSVNRYGGTMVRLRVNGEAVWAAVGRYPTFSATTDTLYVCDSNIWMAQIVNLISPNALNGSTITSPISCSFTELGNRSRPIGEMHGVRLSDMGTLTPGDEFAYGPDTWKIFPWLSVGGVTRRNALCYKKVT